MLIIFDCDGVLVDSETLAAQVFSEELRSLGIEMTPEQCFAQFHGHTLPYCYRWIEGEYQQQLPSDFDRQEFDRQLMVATSKAFDANLKPVEGVVELIKKLRQRNISYCVASNGRHSKINRSLALTGLDEWFSAERRFSVEDVEHGKPAPDLFLYAAEAIGVPVQFCTVIEDSTSGVAAAEAAGMKVMQLSVEERVGDKTDVFRTMNDLSKALESSLQGPSLAS